VTRRRSPCPGGGKDEKRRKKTRGVRGNDQEGREGWVLKGERGKHLRRSLIKSSGKEVNAVLRRRYKGDLFKNSEGARRKRSEKTRMKEGEEEPNELEKLLNKTLSQKCSHLGKRETNDEGGDRIIDVRFFGKSKKRMGKNALRDRVKGRIYRFSRGASALETRKAR